MSIRSLACMESESESWCTIRTPCPFLMSEESLSPRDNSLMSALTRSVFGVFFYVFLIVIDYGRHHNSPVKTVECNLSCWMMSPTLSSTCGMSHHCLTLFSVFTHFIMGYQSIVCFLTSSKIKKDRGIIIDI